MVAAVNKHFISESGVTLAYLYAEEKCPVCGIRSFFRTIGLNGLDCCFIHRLLILIVKLN